MDGGGHETHPLPTDPALAQAAEAVQRAGHWAWIVDDRWNVVFVSDESRVTFGGGTPIDVPLGRFFFGPELVSASTGWVYGLNTVAVYRTMFMEMGGHTLADFDDDRDLLRALVAPELADLVGELNSGDSEVASLAGKGTDLRGTVDAPSIAFRVRRPSGQIAGTVVVMKAAPGMGMLASLVSQSDPRHLERMQLVARAGRRPAAILFADLEGSSALSKRLSTANYFALGRRLVRAADRCVIDAGGIVGRHVGDGVVAFFLAESLGSESAAARAFIDAARSLRAAVAEVAARSGLEEGDVTLRFGLHWGPTLYVGIISTGGRNEVTALGDEVNEGTRIEACAGGGRALASKALVERLDTTDAVALGLDPDRVSYTALADLSTATDKPVGTRRRSRSATFDQGSCHGPSGVRFTCMLLDSPFHWMIRDLGRPAPVAGLGAFTGRRCYHSISGPILRLSGG